MSTTSFVSCAALALLTTSASAQSSNLRLLASDDAFWSVDVTTPDAVNPVPYGGGGLTSNPAFEFFSRQYYMTSSSTPLSLYLMDPFTGATNSTLALTYPPEGNVITSLEFVGSTLYAGLTTSGGIGGGNPSYLSTIDLSTGNITTIGAMGFNAGTGGLAYDGTTMYAVDASGVSATLYTVDLATGAATAVGAVLDGGATALTITGLEFGDDGVLYALTSFTDATPYTLYSVDPSTGTATLIGSMATALNGGAGKPAALTTINAPTGNGSDPQLRLWNADADLSTGDVYDIVFDPVDVDNVIPATRSGALITEDFEYKNGLYYVPSNSSANPAALDIIDATTGALQSTLNLTFPPGFVQVSGVEFAGDTLHTFLLDAFDSSANSRLATIDLNTGAVSTLGFGTALSSPPAGLASNGVFYTAEGGGALSSLYVVFATGITIPLGSIVDVDTGNQLRLTGLEFGVDGILYGLSRGPAGDTTGPDNDLLYAIDLTGLAFNLGPLSSIYLDTTSAESITAVPIVPAGNGSDPQLLLLDIVNSSFASSTIDVGIPDVVSPLGLSTSQFTFYDEFEHRQGVLYTLSSDWPASNADKLDLIDPDTGALNSTTVLTLPSGGNVITSLEFVGGTLYGGFATGASIVDPSSLVAIDTTTGTVSIIGPMGIDGPTVGLAYSDATMYTVNTEEVDATLYTVDLTTGAATPVGPVVEAGQGTPLRLRGLEFGADGRLYGVGGPASEKVLFVIDPASAVAYRLGTMPSIEYFWAFSLTALGDCPTDLNDDGFVNGADLGLFLGNWGNPGVTDLDGDGTTNGADLGLFLGTWGPCT
ncbi:MAG: hypothetical protein ACF8GE_10500 [Phycisphaerales bacterium JB043]